MQLKELIALPIYTNAKVIAGHSGIGNTVQSLTIMDAPDIIHFLKPQELLLTTGYALKDQPGALLALVTNMAAVGCAGLAVKTRRFIAEMPADVLQRADELHFPIIELSLEHSLGDIANQSLSCILEKRTDELHYALTTHKQFSKMIMQGKTLSDMLEELAELTASPIMLIGTDCELLLASSGFPGPCEQSWLEAVRTYTETTAPDSAVELPLSDGEDGAKPAKLELLPIFTFQLEGYLAAASPEDGSRHFRNLAKHAMEQAANVIGLELMKRQAVKERSRRYKNEFFSDFVDGLITSEQELMHRGKYYNLLNQPFYISGVARSDAPFESTGSRAQEADGRSISERDRHYNALKSEIAKLELRFVLFTKSDYFVLIIAPHSPSDLSERKENRLLEQLEEVIVHMSAQHGISLSIGVGNPVSKLTDVPLSYREAVEALQIGYSERKKQFVQPYRAKNFNYLLRMLPREEMKEYYEETFRELLLVEDREKIDLLKTLRVFFDTHCGLAETAKQLFVHRNTVTYRLEKCERLTGRNLRDSAESLRFRTAFAMESLLAEQG
ncbi:PucR family transcriptional regulator [Paenibacillus sp. NPDC058071]|uniref:PucR family transcriptional regulator n=1 Tax=Paenibacillus sp. NPDC058071 TaxID=3346326 RepID=UPI0036D910C9